MDIDTPLAALPIDTALEQLLLAKHGEIDRECERFVHVGDPESLHDLRVAMRRLHSLFVGFAPCFKHDSSQAETLHALFKETNHARDLEVTLALLSKHQLTLPWLQQQWQGELDAEYQRLRECLPPVWWPLSQQFDAPQIQLEDALPAKTLGSYAAMQTKKLKKKLLKQITGVCQQWDDKRAHKLRIRGKRIRYLLEPFAGEQQRTTRAVNRLKRFQDLLGDYHDLVVLRKRLQRLQQNATLTHYHALGQARSQLKQEQQRLRRAIRRDYLGKAYRKLRKALAATQEELAQG